MEPPRVIKLDLHVSPDWAAVQTAWEPCRSTLARAGLGEDEAYQLAMVAQELLENAVKYGAFLNGEKVALALRVAPHDVTIEVKNRVGVDDAHHLRGAMRARLLRGRGERARGVRGLPS